MRLTNIMAIEIDTNKKEYGVYEENQKLANDKLGPLEDAEELCEKIVSQPIYEKFEDSGEIHQEDYTDYKALYNFKERRIEIYDYEFIAWFELDDYGKTWALTKEELTLWQQVKQKQKKLKF